VVWWVLLPRPRRVTSPPLASVVAPSAANNLKSACWYLVSPRILVFASTVVAGTSVVHTSRHGQICFIYWMDFGFSLSLTEFVLDGRSKWASRGGWGDIATHFHFHATPIVECSTDVFAVYIGPTSWDRSSRNALLHGSSKSKRGRSWAWPGQEVPSNTLAHPLSVSRQT
jgi:hypothetical protein